MSVYYRAGLYSLGGGWLEIPVFSFGVNTTGDLPGKQLLWRPEEALREDRCIENTAYPGWYAVDRED